MAASAPNFSVTGFHLSVVKKPKPKVCSAGSDPTANATITPLNSSKTAIAAARVNWRKAASPSRSRSSTLARAVPATDTTKPFGSATSTTECLRTNPKGRSLAGRRSAHFKRPARYRTRARRKPRGDNAGDPARAAEVPSLAPELLRHAAHDVQRLAARAFYFSGPNFLSLGGEFLRHGGA